MIGISSSEPPATPGCCARAGSRDVGKRDRREVRDRLKVLLVRLLKWTAQPGLRYAGRLVFKIGCVYRIRVSRYPRTGPPCMHIHRSMASVPHSRSEERRVGKECR